MTKKAVAVSYIRGVFGFSRISSFGFRISFCHSSLELRHSPPRRCSLRYPGKILVVVHWIGMTDVLQRTGKLSAGSGITPFVGFDMVVRESNNA